MDGTGTLFEPLLACLPKGCEVQVIRYPSDMFLPYEQLETYVAESLPFGRPFLLVAESFSGPIALRLTERMGRDLRAVVLVCSFASRPLGWPGLLLARLPLGFLLRFPLSNVVVRHFLVGAAASDALVHQTRDVISSVKPEVLAARLRQALADDYCARPLSCRTRVFTLYSTNDRLLGRRALRSIAEVCSSLTTQAITAPHFAMQSAPTEVVRSLMDWGVLDEEACS